MTLLDVKDLHTEIQLKRGVVHAVNGVSFQIQAGEALGLIGESGSGKTMTGLSLLGLLPQPAGKIVGGSIKLDGRELVGLDDKTLANEIRGKEIAMISQDPMTSLNPVFTVGGQIAAPIHKHGYDQHGQSAADLAVAELQRVRVPSAQQRSGDYPHQFSGGMRQRVIAAMALGCRPKLLVADEPTSALDVTIQVQFMDLIAELQQDTGVGLLFITHDLGVAASLCQNIAVMYAGRIVEIASAEDLYREPLHPYTQGLLKSVPRLGASSSKKLYSIPGTPPNPLDLPQGCPFQARCEHATEQCKVEVPPLVTKEGRQVACWLEVA
ncbi:MAG: ABC transporter ATP-binding protein [Pseudomonadota bacterium]